MNLVLHSSRGALLSEHLLAQLESLEPRQFLSATAFVQHNLVSDGAVPADHIDAHLKNPWGLAADEEGPVWVADNGTSSATIYDFGTGVAAPLVVTIPGHGDHNLGAPTGEIYNRAEDSFVIGKGGKLGVAKFIFATEDGTIAAWSPKVDRTHAITIIDRSTSGAVYKGLAQAQVQGKWYLYATDFANRRVDVFDDHFKRVTSFSTFIDPTLPKNFTPFGIQAVGGKLVVTYAKFEPGEDDEVDGTGLGRVTVFRPDGKVLLRLQHTNAMNAPWGVAKAPSSFGTFAGDLLVGQFGSGQIVAYNPTTGSVDGLLRGKNGKPIQNDGLWGLIVGNEGHEDTLFFSAGLNDEADGLFGSIKVAG